VTGAKRLASDTKENDKTGVMFVMAVEFYRLCCLAAEIFSHFFALLTEAG